MKKLWVYDLDGTLVDTREDITRAANYMLTQLQAPSLSRDEISGYVGRGLHHLIRSCLRSEDRDLTEKGAKLYRQFYAEHMLDHSQLYPGAKFFLERFRDRTQVVFTNKPNPYAYEMLKALGVGNYFEAVVAGNSGYPKKPDPAALLSIMEEKGIRPREALMIGDSVYDIETARNSGIEIVVLTHGFTDGKTLRQASPDGIFENFKQLLNFAQKAGW